jgi:hypothetical protein
VTVELGHASVSWWLSPGRVSGRSLASGGGRAEELSSQRSVCSSVVVRERTDAHGLVPSVVLCGPLADGSLREAILAASGRTSGSEIRVGRSCAWELGVESVRMLGNILTAVATVWRHCMLVICTACCDMGSGAVVTALCVFGVILL